MLLIISVPFISSLAILSLGRYIGINGGKIISIISITISLLLSITTYMNYLRYNTISIIKVGNWLNTGIINTNYA